MDCRGNCLLFVFVFHLLINVECSLIPFGNGGMGVSMQRPLEPINFKPSNPISGTTSCLLKCQILPNPCNGYFRCPPPKNTLSQNGLDTLSQNGLDIPLHHGFGNQPMNPFSFSTPPPPPPATTPTTTTATTTTTKTTVTEKDVTGKQHNIFTTTTSPFPQSTTKATRGYTVNPIAFWIINKK